MEPDVPAGLAWSDFAADANLFVAFARWQQARRDWIAVGNEWPGGEDVMQQQELTVAITLPDEPFTPAGGHYGRDIRQSEWL